MYTYMYIYIYREREMCICILLHVCIYIYIYTTCQLSLHFFRRTRKEASPAREGPFSKLGTDNAHLARTLGHMVSAIIACYIWV